MDATQVQYVDKVVDVPVVETSQLDGEAHDDVVRRIENAIRECMEATEALQEKVQTVSREVDNGHSAKKKRLAFLRQGPKEQLIEIGGADGACERSHE